MGLLKSDQRDALGLATHLYNTREQGVQSADPLQAVRRLAPPTAAAAQVDGLIPPREEWVRERTQRKNNKNKLTSICAELFPELTQVWKDPNSPSGLARRIAFPTPTALATASVSALQAARSGHYPSTAKRLALQQLAAESIGTQDLARGRGLTFEQQPLIAELALIEQHVVALDAEITQVLAPSRERRILTALPGIGPMQAATISAALGSIATFDRPAHLKAYCGWAPTLGQSGQDAGPREADAARCACAEADAVFGGVGGDPRRRQRVCSSL